MLQNQTPTLRNVFLPRKFDIKESPLAESISGGSRTSDILRDRVFEYQESANSNALKASYVFGSIPEAMLSLKYVRTQELPAQEEEKSVSLIQYLREPIEDIYNLLKSIISFTVSRIMHPKKAYVLHPSQVVQDLTHLKNYLAECATNLSSLREQSRTLNLATATGIISLSFIASEIFARFGTPIGGTIGNFIYGITGAAAGLIVGDYVAGVGGFNLTLLGCFITINVLRKDSEQMIKKIITAPLKAAALVWRMQPDLFNLYKIAALGALPFYLQSIIKAEGIGQVFGGAVAVTTITVTSIFSSLAYLAGMLVINKRGIEDLANKYQESIEGQQK